MISYIKRSHRIASYWAPILNGYLNAYLFFLRSKFGVADAMGHYRGLRFRFRSCDRSAIDETLVRGEYAFIAPLIAQLDTPLIVDIGMNVGDFSIFSVANNPRCDIVGIEADADTAALALSNAPSRVQGSWVVHHRAAWKNNDSLFIEIGPLSVSSKVSASGHKPVEGIDIQTLLALLPRQTIDVMKIDVEGAEEAFLCAAPALLGHVHHLIVELHPAACDAQRVRNMLQQHFARVDEVGGRLSSKPLLYCRQA